MLLFYIAGLRCETKHFSRYSCESKQSRSSGFDRRRRVFAESVNAKKRNHIVARAQRSTSLFSALPKLLRATLIRLSPVQTWRDLLRVGTRVALLSESKFQEDAADVLYMRLHCVGRWRWCSCSVCDEVSYFANRRGISLVVVEPPLCDIHAPNRRHVLSENRWVDISVSDCQLMVSQLFANATHPSCSTLANFLRHQSVCFWSFGRNKLAIPKLA